MPPFHSDQRLEERSPQAAVPAAARRLLLVYNPAAGLRRMGRLNAVVAELRAAGAEVALRRTAARGDAERFAAEADPALADAVVAAGGDGTINEVVNGLAGQGPPRLPLGIIPLGTANVLAQELGLPGDARALARLLARGPTRPVHLGLANGRLFTQMAGVGLDARVVAAVDPHLKKRVGKLTYVLGTLAEILRGPRQGYRVTLERPDGRTECAVVSSCVLCKGRYYGGRYSLAPAADLGAPVFQACLYLRPGRLAALSYVASMVLGGTDRRGDVLVLPALRVRVEALPGHLDEPVQGDGDVVARLPLWAEVAPFALPVIAPT